LKGYKYGDKIIDVRQTTQKTEMQCIKVSNPDNLYITDNYIVTHNTTTATVIARALILRSQALIEQGHSPIDIKRSFEELLTQVEHAIKMQAHSESVTILAADTPLRTDSNTTNVGSITP